MTRIYPALCWATGMMMMAIAARLGWIERDAALTLLLVMPAMAVVSLQRGGCRGVAARGA